MISGGTVFLKNTRQWVVVFLFGILAWGGWAQAEVPAFDIGTGIYDVTGPAAELGMMGYSMPEQKTQGISMRLRSRAFVVRDPASGRRVAFVSVDTGIIPQGITQEVVRRLSDHLGDLYTDKNVLISASHTHSGPGAYSHYALYNLSMVGYDATNFACVAEGIALSILRAHTHLTPGRILIGQGEVDACGWNRSPTAYNNNPAEERAQYGANTDKTMTLLKFVTASGQEIGTLNWFAIHPTSLGNTNRLISGDNKGVASYLFEKSMGTDYAAEETFVAAFAQTNSGDVSPNIFWGYPDGVHDAEHMMTLGTRQYAKALELYNGASVELAPGVDFRHQYVDFSAEAIAPDFMPLGMGPGTTCSPAIGISMLAGSTEDGKGIDVPEGVTYPYDLSLPTGVFPWSFTLMPEDQACHDEKPIALPMGRIRPNGIPLTPEVLPVQILRIGNLAIVGFPTEITTMAGRRLRQTVLDGLGGTVDYVVIAALSNAYAGYTSTREEYAMQHYEGASTHFGPYALNAFQQRFYGIALDMASGRTTDAGPPPRDIKGDQVLTTLGVVFDDKPFWKSFGDVETDARGSYQQGETVEVVFWGAHPRNDLRCQGSYLVVEKMESGQPPMAVAHDWDPETVYRWARDGVANSKVTVSWVIPPDTAPGTYRVRHFGNWKSGWTGAISPYEGSSRVFSVD